MDLTLFNLTCDVTWRRGSKALWVGKFWVLLRTLKLLIPFGYDQGFKLLVYLIIGDELDEIWCTCYRSRSAVMVASWLLFIQILTVCWKTMWTFLKNNFSLIKRIHYFEEIQMCLRIIIWKVKLSLFRVPCCSLILYVVLLQGKKLLDLPKLLDICAIYSHENEDLTRILVIILLSSSYWFSSCNDHMISPKSCTLLLQMLKLLDN